MNYLNKKRNNYSINYLNEKKEKDKKRILKRIISMQKEIIN